MSLSATLRRRLPRPFKAALRTGLIAAVTGVERARRAARYALLDVRDGLTGRRRRLTPPRRLWGLVTDPEADFHAAGDEFVRLLSAHGLQPHHRILDVGCSPCADSSRTNSSPAAWKSASGSVTRPHRRRGGA